MITKLFPARTEKKPLKIIADFDALISEPIGFRFHGKEYEIKPVDTETFMRVAKALQEIQDLLSQRTQGTEVDNEKVYDAYHKFLSPLCPSITLKDLNSMALPQIHALKNLIIRHMLGDTAEQMQGEKSEKKKSLK
jgi:hypothetical protein